MVKVSRKEQRKRKLSARIQQQRELDTYYTKSQMQLTWMRFRRNRLAVVGSVILLCLCFMALFCGFLAPYGKQEYNQKLSYLQPMGVHFIHEDGTFSFRPFVYEIEKSYDPNTYKPIYIQDKNSVAYVSFFIEGTPYKIMGIFDCNLHLFGIEQTEETNGRLFGVYLFGTDEAGRDIFSRVLYGAQISMTVGIVGVVFCFILGLILGGLSGYIGGVFDTVIQRLIDFVISLPTIPIWIALVAVLPATWTVIQRYFCITLILSLLGWPPLARTIRSKFISLKNEDFVRAARVNGVGTMRIIMKHMVPMFTSHLIATLSLAVPGMILGETSLSYLGLGMRAPAVSWGVLLNDAQRFKNIALYPWTIIPGIFVILTVVCFNLLGDGLRDAADPYQ